MANNAIARAREQQIFVVKETTKGTLIAPAAANLVVGAGFGSINQQPTYTNSEEIEDSRDILARFSDRMPPGQWSIPCYCRPSGVAGTAPQEDALLEGLMGLKTVTGGTSVAYSQQMEKSSFSIWMKKGHTVFFGAGCTIGTAAVALSTKGALMWEFGGQLMQMGKVGTDLISGAHSSAETSIDVDDGKKFSVGGLVEFVEGSTTYNNSDAGYEITAISSNTLTIGTGLEEALDDDSTIQPWLPTGTKVGSPLEARKGKANIATVDVAVREFSLDFNDDPTYMEDEITTSDYVEDYVESMRTISGSMSVLFREDDVAYFEDGIDGTEQVIKMIVGDTAGSIITINLPTAVLDVPNVNDIDPQIALDMALTALGSSGEDSATITFT